MTAEAEGICFEVTFLASLPPGDYRYRIDIIGDFTVFRSYHGYGLYNFYLDAHGGTWHTEHTNVCVSYDAATRTSRHYFRDKRLARRSHTPQGLSVLVMLGLYNPALPSFRAFDPVVAIPLQIVRH